MFLFVANAMYMGGQEMKKVLERDNVTIRENLGKVRKVDLHYHIVVCFFLYSIVNI